MIRVGLVGASGYSGAELLRLLLQHPDCGKDMVTLFSSSLLSAFGSAGRLSEGRLEEGRHYRAYAEIYPAFYGLDLRIYGLPAEKSDITEWLGFFRAFDVIFLATPHAASAQIVRHYFAAERRAHLGVRRNSLSKLIDLSGALRLKQPQLYRQWYREETLEIEDLRRCQYGLSELLRNDIRQADVIANPGCYATACILALAPLAAQGLLALQGAQSDVRGRVRIDAKSGVSGAGKKLTESSHFARVNESLSLYKWHQHQHTPEIEMALSGLAAAEIAPITFTTHLLPITRGIMATCYIELDTTVWTDEKLQLLYRDFYANSAFVQLRPANGPLSIPQIQDVSFSNRCDIGMRCDPRNNEVVVVAVVDNLLKGAAGQALQNMNLLLGFEEERGLPLVAALP